MFKDELPKELALLKSAPLKEALERATRDSEVPLNSGRSTLRSLDLISELSAAIEDAWTNDEFEAVPTEIRNNLLAALKRLNARVPAYANGQVGAQELDNEIDGVHLLLWNSNTLDRTIGEKLLKEKNQQLERLREQSRKALRQLDEGLEVVGKLKEATAFVQSQVAETREAAEDSANLLAETTRVRSESAQSHSEIATAAAEAKRLEAEVSETLTRARSSENEVGALGEKVRLFFDEIGAEQTKLERLYSGSDERVSTLEDRSRAVVDRHENLQGSVEEQLQKATGASLFHAFHERRTQITKAKWVWATISIASLVLTVGWSILLAQAASSLDTVFFVRLAGTLPVLAMVVFCLSQYGRERRSEEDYAFKAALSLSLVPYRELVESLEAAGADTEHAKFLVKTIGQIYDPPALAKEAAQKGADKSVLKGIEAVSDIIEKVVNR